MFGERDRYVSPRLLPGYEPYADDMQVELVPDSGHFIVDEKPERAARALAERTGWPGRGLSGAHPRGAFRTHTVRKAPRP